MFVKANALVCALLLAGCTSPAPARPTTTATTTTVVPGPAPVQPKKALGEQIAKTRAELAQVALDLRSTHRALFDGLALSPDTLVDRRADLPAGAVVVEYFVVEDALYAFIVSAGATQPAVVKVKVTSAELTTTVRAFRDAVIAENAKNKQRNAVEALGRQLDDWLLEPLRPLLQNATTVVIVPFGPLGSVPFDALVVSAPDQPVRYAIEDFRFSIQTGRATLEQVLAPARKRRAGSMLAVTDLTGTNPGAQREIARIVKTLPDARVLGKKDATIKTFTTLAGSSRFIHFANHGVLDSDPRTSYLELIDGKLTASDIASLEGLDKSNEMVVLSACEIAPSGEEDATGVVLVTTAFALAGAPTLVTSLWTVDDESAGELMTELYAAIDASGDRLDALRNAKLKLLRTKQGKDTPYAAPWRWAGFEMFGDFRAPAP